jgi:hypothetical protein
MRSYQWRLEATRAAAPAAPRAAIGDSAMQIAATSVPAIRSLAALLASLCFSAVATLVPNVAHPQDATWIGATTDWNTDTNWTPRSSR